MFRICAMINRGKVMVNTSPAVWDSFEETFLNHFFLQKMREANVKEFVNLKQGTMSVKEYGLKLTQLSFYALEMVPDTRVRMRKFVSGLGK